MRFAIGLFLIVIFSAFPIIAQEIPFSKKIIENIFRQNEKGKTHGFKKNERDQYGERFISKYDIWYADKDKTDTIKLYNHRGYKMYCNCLEMTAWNLDGYNEVNFYNVSGNSGTINTEWYKLKITEQNNKVDFQIVKNKVIIKSFTIIKLELEYLNSDPKEPMYILTLKINKP